MKRTAKLWLIAAAALVLIGALTVGGVMAANDWDFSRLSTAQLQTTELRVSESFRDISVDADTEDVFFLPSENGQCTVVFCHEEHRTPLVSVEGGTLTIGVRDDRKPLDHITAFSIDTPTITVYLPQAAYASLSVTGGTGDVSVPADFTFDRISVSLRTGDVDCRASASGPVRIGTNTGKLLLDGVSAGALELSVSTGRAELRSVACAGDAALTVSTGKAFLTDVACGSFSSVGGTGDIRLTDVVASGTLSIERGTGDVSFERCDAAELRVKTDTGDVTGSLRSEKVFIVKTDTGNIDVPATTAGGKCAVTTDTGDVSIAIA